MKNIIPEFIVKNFKNKVYHGIENGTAIYLDIVGFTSMTEQLMRSGKQGVEPLSEIINNLFNPLIQAIYKNDGFITQFAGDSFCSIFFYNGNDDPTTNAVKACIEIQEIFKIQALHRTRFGYFTLSAKVGLACGNIEWGILGEEKLKCYYFKGSGINSSIVAEQNAKKGEIVCELSYNLLKVPNLKTKKISETLAIIEEAEALDISSLIVGNETIEPKIIEEEILLSFIPKIICDLEIIGELREIVCVFISIKEDVHSTILNNIINFILKRVFELNGYFNSLDFGDKGSTILIIFGAPITNEYDRIKAVQFALELTKKFSDLIRISINYGAVYAGFLGSDLRATYTVLGNIVNQCARLMMVVDWGKIWILEKLHQYLSSLNDFQLKFIGEKTFKGVSTALPVYELETQNNFNIHDEINLSSRAIFGRENELSNINKLINDVLENKKGKLIYLYGGVGSGKSRIVQELKKRNQDNIEFNFIYADPIFKKSFSPIAIFLLNYFKINQITEHSQRSFLNELQKFLDSLQINLSNQTLPDNKTNLYNKINLNETNSKESNLKNANLDDVSIKEGSLEKVSLIETYLSEENLNKKINVLKDFLNENIIFLSSLIGIKLDEEKYGILSVDLYETKTIDTLITFFQLKSLLKPIVLVVEDLHFLDLESLHFLEKFSLTLEHFPILLIASGRYTDQGGVYKIEANLEDSNLEVKTFILDQISIESTEQFIESLLGGKISKSLLNFISTRTSNNVFYIEQFCNYLKSDNLIITKDEAFDIKTENIKIPDGISPLVISRLDRLSQKLKEVLLVASVLGYSFDIRILKELLYDKFKEQELQKILKDGVSEQLWTNSTNEVYRFSNELFRIVAYEMQLNERVKKLHYKIANSLIKIFGSSQNYDEEIAYHFEKANYIDKAREYYYNAASSASEHYHLNRALIYYDKLLLFARHEKERESIQEKKIEFLELTGKIDKAIEIVTLWNQEAQKNNLNGKYYKTKVLLAELLIKQSENQKGINILNEVLEQISNDKNENGIEVSEKNSILANTYRNLGRVMWYRGEYKKSLEILTEGVKANSELTDKKGLALNLYYIGVLHLDIGDFEKALKSYHESYDLFSTIGDRFYFTYTLHDLGILSLYQGDTRRAIRYFEQTEKICIRTGYKLGLAIVKLHLGIIEKRRDNIDQALELMNQAQSIVIELKDYIYETYILFHIAQCYFQKNDFNTYVSKMKTSFNQMQKFSARGYFGYIFSNLAYYYTLEKKWKLALTTIYHFFKDKEALGGVDREHGLCFLTLAIWLSFTKDLKEEFLDLKDNELNILLEKIFSITNIKLEPRNYFNAAIDFAKKNNYVTTLAHSLFEYSKFLKKENIDVGYAEGLYKNAMDIALKSNLTYLISKYK